MKLQAFQLTLDAFMAYEPILEVSTPLIFESLALLSAKAVSLFALNLPLAKVKSLEADFKIGSIKASD